MNKILRQSHRANLWSEAEAFLVYLRRTECFEGISGQTDASPYWYGTIVLPDKLKTQMEKLVAEKSLRVSRLEYILDVCEKDLNSPIVRLVGIWGKRFLEQILKAG